MAEIAGTALGAVSLATALSGTLVSAVECIEYAQLGRRFGKDFDKSQARLCALKLQTTRWGVCAGVLPDPRTGQRRVVMVDQETATTVSRLWSAIEDDLNNMERRSRNYAQGQLSSSTEDLEVVKTGDMAALTGALSAQTNTITAERVKGVSWTRKTKWALLEKKYFDRLLEDITENFSQLNNLLPQLTDPQQQLCRIEVEEAQKAQPQEAIDMLYDASRANGDTLLEGALKQALLTRGAGHRWERTEVDDKVELRQGDQIATGFYGRAPVGRIGHDWGTTVGKGESKISQGDTYGNM
jgi:hypothetical protein